MSDTTHTPHSALIAALRRASKNCRCETCRAPHDAADVLEKLSSLSEKLPLEGDCPQCKGSGESKGMTSGHGPDDYEIDIPCPSCNGTGNARKFDKNVVALVEGVLRDPAYGLGNVSHAELAKAILRAVGGAEWDIRGWWKAVQELGAPIAHEDGWVLSARDAPSATVPSMEVVGLFVEGPDCWYEVSDREATELGSGACFLYREVAATDSEGQHG
jgi:hypothetical protein